MDLARLRSDTRTEHEAVEAAMPLMQPSLTREDYIAFLQTLHTLIAGWEDWAAMHAPARLRALVASRRRAPLLSADLAFFGFTPAVPPPFPAHHLTAHPFTGAVSDATFLGAMYVIEGSTLGGQYLARHLEDHFHELDFSSAAGIAYFRGAGERTGSLWKEFQTELTAIADADSANTIAAARSMFTIFREALLRTPASITA